MSNSPKARKNEPQRFDHLLLEVVHRELEGVVSRVAKSVTAVVRRGCHETPNPGL
jgi:hypothetical protein